MKKNLNFLLKQQCGGMLVELMMTLAIAAIMIPFLFRYQQNAVERARNIAVTKQMEAVQNALEKYIIQNRNTYINHATNHTWDDVHLCDLIKARLLPEDFSKDCEYGTTCPGTCLLRKSDDTDFGTYSLRVLKTPGADNRDVLQGVVLLSNEDTPLRTREIVNLGGGKIGYIDNNTVRGGFNVFVRPKTNMGLDGKNKGLVGSTNTLRGSNEYLWRVDNGVAIDATMESNLDLGYQSIQNVTEANMVVGAFSDSLDVKKNINVSNTLSFPDHPIFDLSLMNIVGKNVNVRGSVIANGSDDALTLNDDSRGILYIGGDGYLNNLITSDTLEIDRRLDIGGDLLHLKNLTIAPYSDDSEWKPGTLTLGGYLATRSLEAETGTKITVTGDADDPDLGVVGKLSVGKFIKSAKGSVSTLLSNEGYYWNVEENKVSLHQIALTSLRDALVKVKTRACLADGTCGYSDPFAWIIIPRPDIMYGRLVDQYLAVGNDAINMNTDIREVLEVRLCKARKVLEVKYKCLTSTERHAFTDDEYCKVVKSKVYEPFFKDCKVEGGTSGSTDESNSDSNNDDSSGFGTHKP